MLVVSLSSDTVIRKASLESRDSVFIGREYNLIRTGFSIAPISGGLVMP